MATIAILQPTENWTNSRIDINANFDAVNTELETATTDISTAEWNITALQNTRALKAGDTFTGLVKLAKWADIASATALPLGTATGNYVDVTGVTTITSITAATAGTTIRVRFTGILTLTHNATSLILPSGANITTAVGDVADFTSIDWTNWRCTMYTRATGLPVISTVDINWTTEDTVWDMDADFSLVYDNSAWANRKQKVNVFRATDAETITGTSNTKFITPANLEAKPIPLSTNYISRYWYAWTANAYEAIRFASDVVWFSKTEMVYWLYRYATNSNSYLIWFSLVWSCLTPTVSLALTNTWQMCVIWNYIYTNSGGAVYRLDKWTLANSTLMTESGGAVGNEEELWTDWTYLYAEQQKFSVSGTTLTYVSTLVFTSWTTDCPTYSDWTYVYQQPTINNQDMVIYRWSIAWGARTQWKAVPSMRSNSTDTTPKGFALQYWTNILVHFFTNAESNPQTAIKLFQYNI